MHASDSRQTNGTGGSPQLDMEQREYETKVAEIEAQIREHEDYIRNDLPRSSPLKIPRGAVVKEEDKEGYHQVKYLWQKGDYKYQSRWHTRTPNAPSYQGDSWVVQRRLPGIGSGKNARKGKTEVLVGRTAGGRNVWVDLKVWKAAIDARRNGTATKEQKEMLDNGHWRA